MSMLQLYTFTRIGLVIIKHCSFIRRTKELSKQRRLHALDADVDV